MGIGNWFKAIFILVFGSVFLLSLQNYFIDAFDRIFSGLGIGIFTFTVFALIIGAIKIAMSD
ncbi:hypothetical protein DRN69_00335 [Candidatus Pacearchaeota archaeon]|nr:MAG: hypothetical protein DRN69_00335 [Candidatus Pacearchaeota archaeon]